MTTSKSMRAQMREAYSLIADYKRGAMEPGLPITAEHERLIRLLAEDLDVLHRDTPIEVLVPIVARADSLWNKRTMAVLIQLDDLRRAGQVGEVEATRETFIRQCPSAWYCGTVSAG